MTTSGATLSIPAAEALGDSIHAPGRYTLDVYGWAGFFGIDCDIMHARPAV